MERNYYEKERAETKMLNAKTPRNNDEKRVCDINKSASIFRVGRFNSFLSFYHNLYYRLPIKVLIPKQINNFTQIKPWQLFHHPPNSEKSFHFKKKNKMHHNCFWYLQTMDHFYYTFHFTFYFVLLSCQSAEQKINNLGQCQVYF